MAHDEKALKQLGRRVGAALGSGPDEHRREAQRRAVVGYLRAGGEGRPRRALVVAAAAGLSAAAAAVVLWLALRPEPAPNRETGATSRIAFAVQGRGAGRVGHWIEAQGETVVIRFEGGSRMDLHQQSRARVTRSDERRVAVRLERGALLADVKRREGPARGLTTWNVVAGPYRITVLGTRFRVRWNAAGKAEDLWVAVTRGRVRVDGEGLGDGGVLLRAGQELRVDRRTSRYTVARAPAVRGGDGSQGQAPGGEGGAVARAGADPPPAGRDPDLSGSPGGPTAAGPQRTFPRRSGGDVDPESLDVAHAGSGGGAGMPRTAPAWQRLLRRGRHADAVRAAERAGIERLAATLPAGPLWRLATAGRVARRGATAEVLLKAYRRRFSHSTNAHTAAFLLGRVAMELHGQPASAAKWFRRYLRDAPTGPLAEEALGRYVDACRRAGRTTEARAAARRYLQRYPRGTFAKVARSVLGR